MIDNKDIGLKNYGETLLESLKNSLKNRDSIRKDRYSRMADGSTDIDDCFVSMRVEDHNDQLTNAKIYILENKGFSMWSLRRPTRSPRVLSSSLIVSRVPSSSLADLSKTIGK